MKEIMSDQIFPRFLSQQQEEGTALAEASDLLSLLPMGGHHPQHYLAEFKCRGLVRESTGAIVEASRFRVGIFFPPDYLREARVPEVLSWLGPDNVYHPNIRPPFCCPGQLVPGTSLVDILYQLFEIIVYRKFNPRENDALNRSACAWARNNQDRFPIDPRPLKRVSQAPIHLAQEGGAS